MSNRLPDLLDARRAVNLGAVLEGKLALATFSRLRDLLVDTEGCARFSMAFGKGADGRERVTGTVEARLRLVCQRCLGPMSLDVSRTYNLAMVQGLDEAATLPEEYEPLMVGDAAIRPGDLVEDELLLAIPDFPRHDLSECPVDIMGLDRSAVVESEAGEGMADEAEPNPFAALASLEFGSGGGKEH